MTTLTLSRFGAGLDLGRVLDGIGRLFGSIAAAQRAASEFERMNNQTDAQLAARGVRRAEIARSVFDHSFR